MRCNVTTVLEDVKWQVCSVFVPRGKTIAALVASTPKADPSRLPEAYAKYRKLFAAETAACLPKHTKFDHAITLKLGTTPLFEPIHSLSTVELETFREYLERMLREGNIRPSESSVGAPNFFIPKANGRGLQLYVNSVSSTH